MEGRLMSATGEPSHAMAAHLIRQMSPSDAANVAAILQESPEASHWSVNAIVESVGNGVGWVAEQDGQISGFLIGRAVSDEFEILNMAVRPEHRRRGIASQLVRVAVEWSSSAGASSAHLEVRASNTAAISIYARHGFVPRGRRADYYKSPVDDAILFTRP
jgi:[ribosomal protein S18]-alanine N-acetyltransferase